MDSEMKDFKTVSKEGDAAPKTINGVGIVPLEIKIISFVTIIIAIIPIITLAYENINSSEPGWITFIFLPILIFFSLFPITAATLLWIGKNFSRIFYVIIIFGWILLRVIFLRASDYTLLEILKSLFLIAAVIYIIFSKKSKNFFLKNNPNNNF